MTILKSRSNKSIDDLKSEYERVEEKLIFLKDNPGDVEYKECYTRLTVLFGKINRIVRG